MEKDTHRSPLYGIGIVLGGIVVALLMLLGVFSYLNTVGLPTGLISFLIVLLGVFSLARADKSNFQASLFMILVGLFLFADSLHLLGTGQTPWIWPLFIVLFGLLVLIFQTSKKSHSTS